MSNTRDRLWRVPGTPHHPCSPVPVPLRQLTPPPPPIPALRPVGGDRTPPSYDSNRRYPSLLITSPQPVNEMFRPTEAASGSGSGNMRVEPFRGATLNIVPEQMTSGLKLFFAQLPFNLGRRPHVGKLDFSLMKIRKLLEMQSQSF